MAQTNTERNTTHRASTPVNMSQVAQDTAHATQRGERAHRRTGAKCPMTPHTEHNAPGEHTGVQESSGRGHHTHNTADQAGAPVNRSQVAKDTTHATQHTERAHPGTGSKWTRKPHTQHNTPGKHSGEQEPSGPVYARHAAQHTERAHR